MAEVYESFNALTKPLVVWSASLITLA